MAAEVADVLIIGAGASGGVVGRRLAEAGVDVVALEQGEWPDRADYPGSSAEFELVAARRWSSSPALRGSPADYPIDVSGSDVAALNFNGVGGGTVLYNAQWPRMLPDDFRVRTVDGVADDWPLDYAELQPYYEATDRQFGVSGLGGDPLLPPGADPPLPPLPIGSLALRIARAHARMGRHWWPAPNAINSAPFDGRNACVQRGTCGSGCNEGAKASTNLTHWPRVEQLGGRVITGARVRRIVLDERGRAAGAEWVDREGCEHFTAANVVVVACNGIGTPRLLLNSANDRHPDGIANSSGLVGRRLMMHPLASVTGVFDHPMADGWRAHNGGLIHSRPFAHSDRSRGFVRGALWELGTAGGPMRHVYAPDGRGAWGAGHHAHLARRLGRTASWAIVAEDLPDDANRVELSQALFDSDGIPAAQVHYTISDNTRALLAFHTERARESLLEAGAVEVEVASLPANGHFMGTARMGDDPAVSVVDRWCRSHDVPNLLVVDGSVFVTAGCANPTSTIAALALRAAEHLVTHRREIPTPHHRRLTSVGAPAVNDMRSDPVAEQTGATEFDEGLRAKFAAIADRLIPAGDGMPAASEVGVHGRLLDRVFAARPDLVEPVAAAVRADSGEGPPEQIAGVLRYAVAGAYYLSPQVLLRIRFRDAPPVPVHVDGYPDYIAEGLLDHLLG